MGTMVHSAGGPEPVPGTELAIVWRSLPEMRLSQLQTFMRVGNTFVTRFPLARRIHHLTGYAAAYMRATANGNSHPRVSRGFQEQFSESSFRIACCRVTVNALTRYYDALCVGPAPIWKR